MKYCLKAEALMNGFAKDKIDMHLTVIDVGCQTFSPNMTQDNKAMVIILNKRHYIQPEGKHLLMTE